MSTRPGSGTWVRHALWLGGLLIVLAGLFAMHGLDTHGVESAGHVTMPGASAGAGAGHGLMSDHAGMTGVAGATASGAAVATVQGGLGSGMSMGAAMCMAVLGLGLLALLFLIGTRRAQQLVALVARCVRVPHTQGRDPDPPFLIQLSIQRC